MPHDLSAAHAALIANMVRQQDVVCADHFEKVSPMETNHTLRGKADIQHLAFTSDNPRPISRWSNIMRIIGHALEIV